MYNFKSITVVPKSTEMVDIILSRTQRKTPTVVHKHYQISRIRSFYMRKVKFTQQSINEKLSSIITQFPRLDDVHPFYADLMNVLYDKDHYKVALGQVNNVRTLVDHIAKDYVRMLKYGDGLYRCKQLKRAGMGRMVTMLKKLGGALGYLEQVRQHLSRLPSINPTMRTLLITGFPNVGKSSFINKVTKADVEVQPYAFTTKSLFVGHTDFSYMPWQVIDTPGILDHPLEDRNTIEMQAITALAHLQSCVLYFMDLSGQCGYTISAQVSLFQNIRPLFAGKPLVIAINKTDVACLDDIEGEEKELLDKLFSELGDTAKVVQLSVLKDDNVVGLKKTACEALLSARLEVSKGKKVFESIQNRLHVAQPVARDDKDRPAEDRPDMHIDPDFRYEAKGGETEIESEWPFGEEIDMLPEIVDGKNIADWIDPEIDAKLLALEVEEEARLEELAAAKAAAEGGHPLELSPLAKEAAVWIRDTTKIRRLESTLKRSRSSDNRAVNQVIQQRNDQAAARVHQTGQKRSRSMMEEDGSMPRGASASRSIKRQKTREASTSASRSGLGAGHIDRVRAMADQGRKGWSKDSKQGESDRKYLDPKPKHLFQGKMKTNGKRDWR